MADYMGHILPEPVLLFYCMNAASASLLKEFYFCSRRLYCAICLNQDIYFLKYESYCVAGNTTFCMHSAPGFFFCMM